jgi:hypothetical protein
MTSPAPSHEGATHTAPLIATLFGAAGSLCFMFYAGRRQKSWILMALFTFWVLAPYVVLAWSSIASRRWSMRTRSPLDWLTAVLALAPTAIYGYIALGPPRSKTAFTFLVVPGVTLLLIAAAILLLRRRASA